MTHARLLGVFILWLGGLATTACKPDAPAVPPADAAVAAAVPDAGVGQPAVVALNRVAVRVAADEKAKAVTLLNRGERVMVLETQDTWVRVQLSDGETGYLLARNILTGQITEATLTHDQDLYTRPDALSPVKKRVPAGIMLFVLQEKDGWRLVQLADRFQGWVPQDKAVTDPSEVEAARALWRVELLLEQKKPDMAVTTLQDYLAAYSGARLADAVEMKLATLPVPDGGMTAAADAGVKPVDAGATRSATPTPAAVAVVDAGRPTTRVMVVPVVPSQPLPATSGAAPAAESGPKPMMVLP